MKIYIIDFLSKIPEDIVQMELIVHEIYEIFILDRNDEILVANNIPADGGRDSSLDRDVTTN